MADHGVGLGVDLQNAVLVRPAVDVEVAAVLHHPLRRAVFDGHAGTLDVARDCVPLGVHNEDAVVPKLCDIGLSVRQKVDVARRGEAHDATFLHEGLRVDGEDDVRVVDHDPGRAVADGHRLRRVAQAEAVGAAEHFVLDLPRLGIVVGEGGVAVLEIALVDHEESRARGFELFRAAVVPLHATGEPEGGQRGQDGMS